VVLKLVFPVCGAGTKLEATQSEPAYVATAETELQRLKRLRKKSFNVGKHKPNVKARSGAGIAAFSGVRGFQFRALER
jgi:hypothetical protein